MLQFGDSRLLTVACRFYMSEPRIDALHPLIDLGLKPAVHLCPRYLRLLGNARDPGLHFLAEFGHLVAEALLIVNPGCKLLVGLLHPIADRIHTFPSTAAF